MATFETQVKMKSKEEDIIRGINPRWVGFWMNVIFYELVKKLPLQWVHVPSGNASDKIAPAKLQVDALVRYPQKSRIYASSKVWQVHCITCVSRRGLLKSIQFLKNILVCPWTLPMIWFRKIWRIMYQLLVVESLSISGELNLKITIRGEEGKNC